MKTDIHVLRSDDLRFWEWYVVVGVAVIEDNKQRYKSRKLARRAARRWFKEHMPDVEIE